MLKSKHSSNRDPQSVVIDLETKQTDKSVPAQINNTDDDIYHTYYDVQIDGLNDQSQH
jgi:hypothetical protein